MSLNLIVCGFLGSGKTTLIKRLVGEVLPDRRVVVIENESGEESVDGVYLRDGGVTTVDLRAGCVCCTLRGKLADTMERIRNDYDPECVILEPSGLGDLADLLRIPGFEPDGVVMLVDVERFDLLMRLNRDHYLRQFRLAPVVVLTRTDVASPELTARVHAELVRINPWALITEGSDSFDAAWWLSTVPGRYAGFRALFPILTQAKPRFVTETFPVRRTILPGDLETLFARFGDAGVLPVRAKGCMRSTSGWVKADWLAPDTVELAPIAGDPPCEGFLTCWWSDDNTGTATADVVRKLINTWSYDAR